MRSTLFSGVLAIALLATGCVYSEVGGALYTDVKGPLQASMPTATGKTGQSCSSSILGLIAMGDASIESAKRNGKITKVTSVDHHSRWLVVWGEFCTIVTGE